MSEPVPAIPNEPDPSLGSLTPAPEAEAQNMETTLRANLEKTTVHKRFLGAKDQSNTDTDLFFLQPDGTIAERLPGPCDEQNRQMLDTLYRLAHADPSNATAEARYYKEEDATRKIRTVPTSNGFEFVEQFVDMRHPTRGEERYIFFRVFCRPIGGGPILAGGKSILE